MQVCKSIEKVQGGYIVEIPFPYANYSDGQKRVCQSWTEVLNLLTRAAHEDPSTEEQTRAVSGVAGDVAKSGLSESSKRRHVDLRPSLRDPAWIIPANMEDDEDRRRFDGEWVSKRDYLELLACFDVANPPPRSLPASVEEVEG